MTGLAIKLDFSSMPTPASAFVDFLAAISNFDTTVEEALARARASMDTAERGLFATLESMQATMPVIAAALAQGAEGDLDPIIEQAEATESEMRAEADQVELVIRQNFLMLKQLRPKFLPQMAPLADRYRDSMARYLAGIQDIRWQLMALRAEQHRDEKGPEFSDPEKLERYLTRTRH